MLLYYLLFIVSVLGFLFSRGRNCSNVLGQQIYVNDCSRKYMFLLFSFMTFIVGLRNVNVGIDSANYVSDYFQSVIKNGIFNGNQEIILNIIALVSSVFSKYYTFFFFVTACITFLLFARFIYFYSNNVYISIIVFIGLFFVQSMNLMREWLAIAIGLNSFDFFYRKKNKMGYFVLMLAVFTHITSIVYIFIPFYFKRKNKEKTVLFTLIICIIIVLFYKQMLSIFVSIFPKFYDYLYTDFFHGSSSFNIKDLIYISFLLAFICIYNSNSDLKINSEKLLLYICFMLISITFSICGQSISIFHRLVYYYSIFMIVSLPEFAYYSRNKNIYILLIIAFSLFMLYRNSFFDNNGISVYKFFWE